MLLAGIDWKSMAPDRLINVLSVLVARHVAHGEEYSRLQSILFDGADVDPEQMQREYEESLDENGLPRGLLEMPKG